MDTQPRTVLARITQWLESLITASEPGQRLPTDRDCARQLHCSMRSVQTAKAALEQQGKIQRIRGSGSYVAFAPSKEVATLPKLSASETVAAHVSTLISQGSLKRDNPLPQIKEVALRFGVAQTTVSQAYRLLQTQNLVTRIGRHYFVGSSIVTNLLEKPPTAIICNVSDSIDTMVSQSELGLSAYRFLERELMDCGYKVSIESGIPRDSLATAARPSALIISYISRTNYDHYINLLSPLFRSISNRTRVLLVTGSYRRPPSGVNQLCAGHLTTTRARTLAHFVLQKKYRSLAFFQRENTMNATRYLQLLKITRDLLYFCPDLTLRVMHAQTDSPLETGSAFDAMLKELDPHYLNSFLGKYEPRTFDSIERITQLSSSEHFALEHFTHYDAWLFSSQSDAAYALQWLKEHSIAVPQHKHIVVLEDLDQYFGLGITYCGSDWKTIGYLMAHAVIGDFPIAKTSRGFIHSESLVLQRHTTMGTVSPL